MVLITARKLSLGITVAGTCRSLSSNGVTPGTRSRCSSRSIRLATISGSSVASRAVAHQAVGVEIDPGIAEDAAERLCWVDLDALHDQVQIVDA